MIMRKFKFTLSVVVFIGLFVVAAVAPPNAGAAVDVFKGCAGDTGGSAVCASTGDQASSMVRPIITTTLTILGAIAVLMIIVGGIMYTISAGDPGKTKKAKDTVLYSVIGLVVALLSYGIIEFVISRVA